MSMLLSGGCFALYSRCNDASEDDCWIKWHVSQERLDGSKPRARQASSVSDCEAMADWWCVRATVNAKHKDDDIDILRGRIMIQRED